MGPCNEYLIEAKGEWEGELRGLEGEREGEVGGVWRGVRDVWGEVGGRLGYQRVWEIVCARRLESVSRVKSVSGLGGVSELGSGSILSGSCNEQKGNHMR